MNLNPLLIKPIPYSDESAASLLIRAADANGFPNVYSLCHSQSKSYPKSLISHVTNKKRFRTLLQLLKLSEDYISLALPAQPGKPADKKDCRDKSRQP